MTSDSIENLSPVDWLLFSVDPVIFTIKDSCLQVLLVKRKRAPFVGRWSLPGGRVDKLHCANLAEAVRKKLFEKTGLDQVYFEQVFTDGGKDMDPRGWSLTTVYLALVWFDSIRLDKNQTGEEVRWHPVDQLNTLGEFAFWHKQIIEKTVRRLQDKVTYTDLPLRFMPEKFTIRDLRIAYEVILNQKLPRPSFAKRILDAGILTDTGEKESSSHRPAPLYSYKPEKDTYIFPRALNLG